MLKDTIKYEKSQMNRIRYVFNYRIIAFMTIPIFGLLILIAILTSIDEQKYNSVAILLFIIDSFLMLGIGIASPFIIRKENEIEIAKWKNELFGVMPVKNLQSFLLAPPFMSSMAEFTSEGIIIKPADDSICDEPFEDVTKENEYFFPYHNVKVSFEMSNPLRLVKMFFSFEAKMDGAEEEDYFFIPLSQDLIKIVKKHNLTIENSEQLDYVLNNLEEAVTQILKYGKIKKMTSQ
jgi:hypothetical protein